MQRVINIIRRFMSGGYKNISYLDLDSFEVLTWYDLAPGIRSFRYPTDASISHLFETEMAADSVFDWHVHNNCRERIFVRSGRLMDMKTGKEFGPGSVMIFNPGIEHAVKALENSVFYVHFFIV